MKVLYFEGAGWSGADISKATVGNCRIRTAFHLDPDKRHPKCSCLCRHNGDGEKGPAVYLEIIACERTKNSPQEIYHWQYTGFVDTLHYITDEKPNDDCNGHHIVHRNVRFFKYNEESILKFVNSLGASFDAIKVVPDLGGFRVFPERHSCDGPDGYRYGDEFQFDPVMTARREAVYDKVYDIEMDERIRDRDMGGKKFAYSPSGGNYPNFSLWVDEEDPGLLHLLRHFIGYNKHWSIRTDVGETLEDWMATAKETPLGRYGC